MNTKKLTPLDSKHLTGQAIIFSLTALLLLGIVGIKFSNIGQQQDGVLGTAEAQTGSPTVSGQLISYSTIYSIGVEWHITGDEDHNAQCTVQYRVQGTGAWKQALPLFRVDFNNFNMLAGSVLFLEQGITYEVQLDLTDPDGGADSRIITVTTRAVPNLPTGGRTFHVVPGTGGGDGSEDNPFKGIASAQAVAQPGDIFLLHGGDYGGRITFNKAGAPGNYIVWKAYGDGVAFFNGIEVATSHIWLEGLKVSVLGGSGLMTLGAPEGVVISRNTFTGCHYSIYFNGGGSGWYIADNIIVGDVDPASGDFSGEGIELNHSSDHTVAYNRISHTADGASYALNNCDIFGNDIFDTSDDGIEPDYGLNNIRIWGNRLTNVGHHGVSFQDQLGAPWYIIRNQIITGGSVTKLFGTDRFLLAHNTFVGWVSPQAYHSGLLLNGWSKNNLWVSVTGSYMWYAEGAVPATWKTDLDYDGFDWVSAPYPFGWGPNYPDIASFSAATGLETHGVRVYKDTTFETFNVPGPTSAPLQYMTLKPNGDVIDKGVVLANINEDYTGSAPDLGAYEYGKPLPQYGPRFSDDTPPSAPIFLSAVASGENVNLSWTAPTDLESGIMVYKLYRGTSNGGEVFYQDVDFVNFQDTNTQPDVTYYYQVSAVNGAGLESELSNEVQATTGDVPPLAPQNLRTIQGKSQATLMWDNNQELDLDHYNIYRGTTQGFTPQTPIDTSVTNKYTDTGLTNDITYYYKISAVDQAGNEGAYSQEASAIPGEHLVAHWKFDEGSGTQAIDSSGNGNNGAVNGAVWTSGVFGNALSFDGVDDYVAVPDSPILGGMGALTIAGWVKFNVLGGHIVEKRDVYGAYYADQRLLVWAKTTGDEGGVYTDPISAGKWYHFAFVYDGEKAYSYLDGKYCPDYIDTGSGTVIDNGYNLAIGARTEPVQNGGFINGSIDELRIYGRALSEAEIKALAETEPDETPPAAITNLSANTGANVGEVNLTWTATGDDGDIGTASSYIIKYAQAKIIEANWDSATTVASLPSPKTAGAPETFTVTGLTPSQTYYFAIKAYDEWSNAGGISNSPNAMAKEQDTTPPATPQNLQATANGEKIDLTWTASIDPESGVANYKLYRGTSSEGETFYKNVGKATNYQDTGTLPNTTYYYQVSAINGSGLESELSNEAQVTTGDNPPGAPQNLTASSGNNMVTLSWDANPEQDMDHYNIYRSTTQGFTPSSPIATFATNSYTDNTVANGITYYYRVSAVDKSDNEGGYSNEVSATPTEETNLVAYWKFDEGTGSTITDSSGNGNNGTIYGGASWITGAECKSGSGSCLSFDSSYVKNSVPVNMPSGDAAFTIGAWIKPANISQESQMVIGIIGNSGAAGIDAAFFINPTGTPPGTLGFHFGYSGVNTTSGVLSNGQWYHIAVTKTPGTVYSTTKIYVNGTQQTIAGQYSDITPNITGIKVNLGAGWWNNDTNDPYFGLIDEVRIYKRALTPEEILALYQQGTQPKTPNLTLTKSADKATVQSGDIITYTIQYQNIGTGDAKNVIITDPIPQGATYVAGSADATAGSFDGTQVVWNIGEVKAGGSGSVGFQVRVE